MKLGLMLRYSTRLINWDRILGMGYYTALLDLAWITVIDNSLSSPLPYGRAPKGPYQSSPLKGPVSRACFRNLIHPCPVRTSDYVPLLLVESLNVPWFQSNHSGETSSGLQNALDPYSNISFQDGFLWFEDVAQYRFHSLDPRADTTVDNSQEVPIEGCRDRDIAARFKEIPGRESAVPTGLCMDTENRSIERQAHRRDTRIETCMVGLHNRCATSWFSFGIDLILSLYNRFQKRIPQMKRKASFPPTTSTSYEIGDPTGNRLHLPNDTYTKHGTGRHSMAQQGAELVSHSHFP